MTNKPRLIIGITGASGFILAEYLLKYLYDAPIEVHLVMTKAAQITRQQESKISLKSLTPYLSQQSTCYTT